MLARVDEGFREAKMGLYFRFFVNHQYVDDIPAEESRNTPPGIFLFAFIRGF